MIHLRLPVAPWLLTAMSLTVLLAAAPALAACGDDVDGKRVPCRCGDVVVSSTRLQPGDPVVAGRCPADGLIVRAQPGADSIRLDLAGLSLLGSGHGTGIRVLDGGKQGASIIAGGENESAEVVGFGTGFRARGQRSVRELRDIGFTANARNGVNLRGAGTDIVGVTAERNGGDGMRIGGRSPRLENVEAQQNGRFGLRVTSSGANVGAVVAAGNERAQMQINKNASGEEAQSR
jgi:hypothetical protein